MRELKPIQLENLLLNLDSWIHIKEDKPKPEINYLKVLLTKEEADLLKILLFNHILNLIKSKKYKTTDFYILDKVDKK